MKTKLKDSGLIALIIACIFATAYGLVLMSTPIINLEAYVTRNSTLDETFVVKHLNDQLSTFKKQWILENGLKTVGSRQYNDWVKKRINDEKIIFESKLDKALYFREVNSQIYKDFSAAKKNAIFSIVGQKTNHNLWYLFFKGLIIYVISFVLFLFVNKDKYLDQNNWTDEDFEKLFLVSLAIALTGYLIIITKLILSWANAPEVLGVSFVVVVICVLLYFAISDIFLSIAIRLVDWITYLSVWMQKGLNWLAYQWLEKFSGTDILGVNILNSLYLKGEFFIISNDGVQKNEIVRKIENGVPIFDRESGHMYSFDSFYQKFTAEPKDKFVRLFHEQVMSKFHDYFSEKGELEIITYAEKLVDSIREKTNQKLTTKDSKLTYDEAETMLLKLCTQSLKLFRKDLVSLSQERVHDITTGLRNSLYNEIRRDSVFNFSNKDFYCKTILPRNTKSFMSLGYLDVFVIEQAPQKRTIRHDGCSYFLAFPYTIFVITFENEVFKSLQFFYSDKSLSGLDDRLYHPSLHNIDSDNCRVCVGGNVDLGILKGSLGEKANSVVSSFWQTNFNNDISSCFDYYEEDFEDYETWEKMSEDPQFFSGITLSDYGSLRNEIDGIFEEIIGEASVKESLKKLRSTVDSWFSSNDSNVNEQIMKMWSEINVKHFSKKVIDDLTTQKNIDREALFVLIKGVFLGCINDKNNKKDFLTTINQALEQAVENDFLELSLLTPLEINPSFSKLLNVK